MVDANQANVKQLQALQSFEKIYAPFDGVITARNTDIGDLINSGSSGTAKTDLFHISQPNKLRVYVNVPEEHSQRIKVGMTADLNLAEFPGRKFQGKLVRTSWLGILLGIAALLSGCAVGPKYHPAAVQAPPAYKEVGDWKPAQPNDQNLGGTWWTIFQDPQLDTLELQVNVSNQNLKAAEAQFQQARAVLRYYRADYYPTVTAGPSAARTQVSANAPTSTTLRGSTYNNFVLPFDFSYQADVWGRVRKNVESYREQAQASAADLASVNLSLHADLAIDYFLARSLDAQEQLLNSTVTQYEQALELIESRFAGGIASEVEVQQAKTQLETTRAQAIDVGVARSQYEHAVAILLGKPPAEFSLPPLPLTAPPPDIPVSMPSELLERRPDIAAAERRAASTNAQIGVAKSAYYPLINLAATGGF